MLVHYFDFVLLGYWQFHLPNGSWENFTDIDVACALFKELGIPDTHQGAVLMDGLNQNEFLEVKYRTRRSIVFSDDTVNATSLFKLEVDHPLKDVSQLQFQRFYSNDYRELSDFIPYTDDRYVQNETEATEGYHLTNFVGDVELKVPWRDRHRNPHPITNCSSQDDVELRNNDTPPNEESANRTSNDAVLNSDFPVTTRTSQNQIVPSINSTFQYQMPNLMNSTFQTNSETLNSTFFNFQPYSMNSTFPFQFPTSNNSSYQNQMATPRNSSPQTQTLTSETSSSETQMPISETWTSVTQIPTLESSSSPINMPHSATPSSQTQIPTLQVTSHFQMPTLINSSLQYQSSGNYGESLTSNLSHWAPELNTSGISDHVSKYPFFTSSTINPFDEMDNNNIIVKYFINFQIKAVFLPSNARLRFVRHNSTVSWWSILMAMSGSKLAFVAWDGSESMEHGKSQNVSFQLCTLQNEVINIPFCINIRLRRCHVLS